MDSEHTSTSSVGAMLCVIHVRLFGITLHVFVAGLFGIRSVWHQAAPVGSLAHDQPGFWHAAQDKTCVTKTRYKHMHCNTRMQMQKRVFRT